MTSPIPPGRWSPRPRTRGSRAAAFPRDRRDFLSYFACFATEHRRQAKSLQSDHEPDELESAITSYATVLDTRARVMARSIAGTLALDDVDARDDMFFGAVEYARKHPAALAGMKSRPPWRSWQEAVAAYVAEYGEPRDLEERILKAEVAGDEPLAEALRSCRPPGLPPAKGAKGLVIRALRRLFRA